MHVRNMSAHGSTRATCIRSNGRIQIRSNTKDASTGRNTNTSFLVATDMHATETLNQQWAIKQPSTYLGFMYLWVLYRPVA